MICENDLDLPEEERTRWQKLHCYLVSVRDAGEISPETAEYAQKAWERVSAEMGKAMSVPDASYGPDGQFLFIWDKAEHHLELEIESCGTAYFFYRNRTSGALWDSEYKVGEPLSDEIMEKLRVFV